MHDAIAYRQLWYIYSISAPPILRAVTVFRVSDHLRFSLQQYLLQFASQADRSGKL